MDMLHNLPILIKNAAAKRISPSEMSRRWDKISSEIQLQSSLLKREFDFLCSQVSGRTSKAKVQKVLGRIYTKEISQLNASAEFIEKWISRKGGSAYLNMAEESLNLAEELWRRRIKALADLSDILKVTWIFPSKDR